MFNLRFRRHIDQFTIYRTAKRFASTHKVEDKKRFSRLRKLCSIQRRVLRSVALNTRWDSISTLSEKVEIATGGGRKSVSRWTVAQELASMGFKRRPAAQKPLLNEEKRARRLDFATRHAGQSATWWRNVIFSDEKIFRAGNNRRALLVTRRSSERLKPGCMNTAPKHSLQVHVWGAIGWAGVGPLKLVQGTLNAAAYQQQILIDIRNTCQMLAPR